MRLLLSILSLFILFSASAQVPVFVDDKVGYIDKNGRQIIEPKFRNGYSFSEGLAAVRENGFYGYIDNTGHYIIPPKLDLAFNFKNDIALVYVNAKPVLINKAGNIVFPPGYESIQFVNDHLAIVSTASKKVGLADFRKNILTIDTIYSHIKYADDVAIVTEYNGPRTGGMDRVGVVDSKGKKIVAFGKYVKIESFTSGFALAEVYIKDAIGNSTALIDKEGKERFIKKYDYSSGMPDGNFHDGLARTIFYKNPKSKNLYSGENQYQGYINVKGDEVFKDSNVIAVSDFSGGRAFIEVPGNKLILIDKTFKQIGKNSFSGILQGKFHGNYAIVNVKGEFGIINKNGDFVVQPSNWKIEEEDILEDHFIFRNTGGQKGLANFEGKIIVEPIFEEISRDGFDNDILKAQVDDTLFFVNRFGKTIWRSKIDDEKLYEGKVNRELDIDFMNRGYFTAYSSPGANGDYSNGWWTSPNIPKKLNGKEHILPNALNILIDTTTIVPFAAGYGGYRVTVSNTKNDTVKFNAQDSRLYMVMQARNPDGQWKDIEYTPRSWCGNSYHQIALEPGSYWTFTAAKYSGEIKTTLRIRLTYIDPSDEKSALIAYSNEIEGSINPAQFWNKRAYSPNGIMDPYFE